MKAVYILNEILNKKIFKNHAPQKKHSLAVCIIFFYNEFTLVTEKEDVLFLHGVYLLFIAEEKNNVWVETRGKYSKKNNTSN